MFKMRAQAAGLLLSLMAGGIASVAAMPAAHATTGTASVTSFSYVSDPDDTIGHGATGSFVEGGSASITVTGSAGDFTFRASDGTNVWNGEVAAQFGNELRVGSYTDAERTAFRDAGHPGLDITLQSPTG